MKNIKLDLGLPPSIILGLLAYSHNWSIIAESYCTVSGAKGQFSSCFDIIAFGGLQEVKGTSIFFFFGWGLSIIFILIVIF